MDRWIVHNRFRAAVAVGDDGRAARAFHRALPGYAETPLLDAAALADALGVRRVLVKDESSRFGLPSFKAMGASYATARAIAERRGVPLDPGRGLDGVRAALGDWAPRLVCATDGNHGRAVAWIAGQLGLPSRIHLPASIPDGARRSIAAEGAGVVMVDGTYDDAVREAVDAAGEADLIVSDTSWPGYESVPRAVVEGYGTILDEVAEQLAERGERWPDLTVVPVGVGSLASAVVRAARRARGDARIASAEPLSAACLLAALRAGRPTEVPGPHGSAMAGLNCGLVSPLAWPELRAGIDVAVAVTDAAGRRGVGQLRAAGVDAGPCAGAAPAAATALLAGAGSAAHRSRLDIDEGSSVLLLATDGSASTA
jgi:diaminopropionate ammonia-lyase